MTYTGGPLNSLYGQSRASDPKESIHVMSLIREHDPSTPDDLYKAINRHYHDTCGCGIEGGGTVEEYGDWLYEAQHDVWDEYRFDRETCRQWIYDLFIMQSLKGHNIEREAKKLFERSFDVSDVADFADNEYRVDLIVENDGGPIAGLQVKPESYKEMRDSVKDRNKEAHDSIDEPVFYLYYDYDTETFTNAERVLSDMYELTNGGSL